jgi:hypothetical protein
MTLNNPNKITTLIILCLFFILSVILLCGCSPQKRLNRLVAKHPELINRDTIYRNDTTIINGTIVDTVFKSGITKDTIIIKENNLTIKYFNDGKTTYIKGKVDTITVIKKVPLIVNSVSVKPLNRKEQFVMWVADNLAWIILVAMGLFYLLKRLISLYLPIIKAYLKIP